VSHQITHRDIAAYGHSLRDAVDVKVEGAVVELGEQRFDLLAIPGATPMRKTITESGRKPTHFAS
jgi:hypothetical protein